MSGSLVDAGVVTDAHPVELSIAPGRTALVLVDVQRDLAAPGGKVAPDGEEARARLDAAVAQAIRALDAARRGGTWVVHAHTVHRIGFAGANLHAPLGRYLAESGALLEGSDGALPMPGAEPRSDEWVIPRRTMSAFASTELELLLRGHGISTIVLAGLVTHLAVEGTARDACDRGFRVLTLHDACASAGVERHLASLDVLGRVGALVSTEAWCTALDRAVEDFSMEGLTPTVA